MQQANAEQEAVATPKRLVSGAKMPQVWWLGLVLLSAGLLVLLASQEIHAVSISGDLTPQQSQQQSGDYNNLENLISDLLDDAGNRLKKSKLSSMRQIKQTLRFGRRSDPLMAPTYGGREQLEPNGNGDDSARRRLLALENEEED